MYERSAGTVVCACVLLVELSFLSPSLSILAYGFALKKSTILGSGIALKKSRQKPVEDTSSWILFSREVSQVDVRQHNFGAIRIAQKMRSNFL